MAALRTHSRLSLSLLALLMVLFAAPAALATDTDADGIHDAKDNCLGIANPSQLDADLDGYGNACDADFNGNGVVDLADVSEAMASLGQPDAVRDLNGNGAVDSSDLSIVLGLVGSLPGPSGVACAGSAPCIACSFGVGSDRDGDTVDDDLDNCLDVPNGPAEAPNDQLDGTSPPDGFGNICDGDFDENGWIDYNDRAHILNNLNTLDPEDLNANGVIDLVDLSIFISSWPDAIFPNTFFPGPSGIVCESQPETGDPLASGFPAVSRERTLSVLVDPQSGSGAGLLPEAPVSYAPALTYAVVEQPASGRIVVEDAATGHFRFVPDPGSDATTDRFTWVVTDGHAMSSAQDVTLLVQRPADTSYVAGELNDRALVVYNANAPDALQLATYYANARSIDPARLCPVEMPNGLYATKDQMLSMRKQIVEGCVCPAIPSGERPSPCEVGPNLQAIADASPISHLVLVKGLPARLHGTGWPHFGAANPGDAAEPSLDFYLSYLLYRDEDLFCPGCPGPMVDEAVESVYDDFGNHWEHFLPSVDPGDHRVVAYGRVEAIDTARTLDLIDRTLAAEAAGLQGNVLTEFGPDPVYGVDEVFGLAISSTGTSDSACVDYPVTSPFTPWPHATCRVGTTYSTVVPSQSGAVPGVNGSHVPIAMDVGLFLGGNPAKASQAGFNGMAVMTNWHKSATSCTELCRDMPDPASEAACRAASTDYFQEINTACVGVAPGFIGGQIRSYPVAYYGFYPSGWIYADTGHAESTPPVVREGGAYTDGVTFTDDRYLHLGAHDWATPDASTCVRVDGTPEACPEEIVLYLRHRHFDSFVVDQDRDYLVRVRHRNRANPGGQLRFHVQVRYTDDTYASSPQATIDLSQATPGSTWATSTATVTLPASGKTVQRFDSVLSVRFDDDVREYLDLDAVEVIDQTTALPVLPTDIGSFARTTQEQTAVGDWAANAIDRLGGIAFWGSSSHHITGGWAYSGQRALYRNLLSGRSLGESVLSAGGGESGILYGDPLYRPVAAVLYSTEPASKLQPWAAGALFQHPGLEVTAANLATARTLTMSVLHGTASLGSVQWELATCGQLDLQACDAGGLWVTQQTGTGAVKEHPFDWTTFIDPQVDQPVVVRLKVQNPGEPGRALYDYAFFDYRVNAP